MVTPIDARAIERNTWETAQKLGPRPFVEKPPGGAPLIPVFWLVEMIVVSLEALDDDGWQIGRRLQEGTAQDGGATTLAEILALTKPNGATERLG